MLQHAKTIEKLLLSYIYLNGVTIASSTAVITAAATTALATGSTLGTSVPVQPSDEANGTDGIFTGTMRLPVVDNSTLEGLTDDTTNNEVFGRVVEASGVYTLNLHTLTDAGVEQAAVVADGDITVGLPYLFKFVDFPSDAAVRFSAHQVGQDSAASGGRIARELVAVSALNTLAALSQTPFDLTLVSCNIDGHLEDIAGGAFSVVGTAVTWLPVVAEYPLETTDKVIVGYTL